jgi:nucleoside-specific outer membrane channel protein Tsx
VALRSSSRRIRPHHRRSSNVQAGIFARFSLFDFFGFSDFDHFVSHLDGCIFSGLSHLA